MKQIVCSLRKSLEPGSENQMKRYSTSTQKSLLQVLLTHFTASSVKTPLHDIKTQKYTLFFVIGISYILKNLNFDQF